MFPDGFRWKILDCKIWKKNENRGTVVSVYPFRFQNEANEVRSIDFVQSPVSKKLEELSKNFQLKKCRSKTVLHFCSWQLFDSSSRFWEILPQKWVAREGGAEMQECLTSLRAYLSSLQSYQKVSNYKNVALFFIYSTFFADPTHSFSQNITGNIIIFSILSSYSDNQNVYSTKNIPFLYIFVRSLPSPHLPPKMSTFRI